MTPRKVTFPLLVLVTILILILFGLVFVTAEEAAARSGYQPRPLVAKVASTLKKIQAYNTLSTTGNAFVQEAALSPGWSVAIDGDTVVLGAPYGYDKGGAAYVFVREETGWVQQATLIAQEDVVDDLFGAAVAIDDDTVLVTAPYDKEGENEGVAYVFVRDGTEWTQQAKLTINESDALGHGFRDSTTAVAVDGDTAIIGGYRCEYDADGYCTNQSGEARVFVRKGTTWTEQDVLVSPDSSYSDGFGHAVALDGDTALIGAHSADHESGEGKGAAYVFVREGTEWSYQTHLTSPDLEYGFGRDVAVDGDTALVGGNWSSCHPRGGCVAGVAEARVFVREGTTWSEQALLLPSDSTYFTDYGNQVALSGNIALVAISSAFEYEHDEDRVFVFVREGTNWKELPKLTSEKEYFPYVMDLDGDTAVIGTTGVALVYRFRHLRYLPFLSN